jgi:cyd operon protein YbgT
MWYFTWILGIGLACSFAILNAMWYEVHAGEAPSEEPEDKS